MMALIWAEILKFFVSISWRAWAYAAVVLLVFVGGCTLGCNCARGDEPRSCPVNGNNCPCGCRSGGQCNCAVSNVAPERLTRRTGFDAYCDVVRSLRPCGEFYVFVHMEVEKRHLPAVRWDGYPGVTVPCEIVGVIGDDGNPYEKYRRYPKAPVVHYLPLVSFGATCRSCR